MTTARILEVHYYWQELTYSCTVVARLWRESNIVIVHAHACTRVRGNRLCSQLYSRHLCCKV